MENMSYLMLFEFLLKLQINPNIQTVFHHMDPNIIADIIMETLNGIIDMLAPLKIVPIKKDHIPYIDSDTRKAIKQNKNQLTNAIFHKNEEGKWRVYRRERNRISKIIATSLMNFMQP